MAEQFANNASAQVGAGGIDAAATALPVTGALNCPATGTFRIKIENELLKVTTGGQAESSWTVVRGDGGTAPAAHAEGATIKVVLTKEALEAKFAEASGGGGGGFTNPMT
ncbi:MAG: hypothetical protein IRY99_07955, partial [Isosphaeraceae bacterium]|nr:hypothetical protein [Isosphaeraceae bacterium]